jgi:hypothetical protein
MKVHRISLFLRLLSTPAHKGMERLKPNQAYGLPAYTDMVVYRKIL